MRKKMSEIEGIEMEGGKGKKRVEKEEEEDDGKRKGTEDKDRKLGRM